MLKEVREGKINCIVVKDLSRFGRNYIEVGDYLEQIFPFMGVRFISVADHFDSAHQFGGIEIGFKNLMHDLYSRDLSKKVRTIKRLYQESGKYTGGDVPFGYRRNSEGKGIYQPDACMAEVVKVIFRMAQGGIMPQGIAKYLNEQHTPTPGVYKNRISQCHYQIRNEKQNFWTSDQVKKILCNEVYLGTHVCHKYSMIEPKKEKANEQSEYLRFENDHEALVTKEVFETAQMVIKSGKKEEVTIRGKKINCRGK